jgi:hypothetical protein
MIKQALLTLACWLTMLSAGAEPPAPPDVPLDPQTDTFDALALPLLAAAIAESRDAAVREGVETIPRSIRAALRGYVPDAVLDRARWRVGGGGWLSLQRSLIGFGYSPAVTMDHAIVFETAADARDPKLWAHELRHVEQFMLWGIEGFAARYIANFNALENDAAEYRWTWMRQTGRVPPP